MKSLQKKTTISNCDRSSFYKESGTNYFIDKKNPPFFDQTASYANETTHFFTSSSIQKKCANGEPNDCNAGQDKIENNNLQLSSTVSSPIMEGTSQKYLMRQDEPTGETSTSTTPPSPSTVPSSPSTVPSSLSTIPSSMVCTPLGLTRADFLSRNGNDVTEFGHTNITVDPTMLNPSTLTFQRVGRSRRFKPTAITLNLPLIESIFTQAGFFIEGSKRVVFEPDGDCLTDTYDLRWQITSGGASKIQQGEQEHCDDYNYAYANSVLPYVTEVNRLAASTRSFGSEREAKRYIQRRIGFNPDDWFTRFSCLLQRSLERDHVPRGFTRSSHDPIPFTQAPNRHNRCRYATVLISERSLPQVGQTPSSAIITGC